MTSSQPVVTPTALNFTPDNKRVYAYSGLIGVDSTETTLLDFTTQSEYIDSLMVLNYAGGLAFAEDFYFQIYFNDVVVFGVVIGQATRENANSNGIPMVIPPFTTVKITADNITDGDTRLMSAHVVGMAYGTIETGYQ